MAFPTWFRFCDQPRRRDPDRERGVHLLAAVRVRIGPGRWRLLQMAAIAWVMLQLMFIPLLYVVAAAGFFTFVSGIIYVMDGFRQLGAQGHANANGERKL